MRKKRRALTLVEVCVGIVVLSIALTAIVQVFYFSALATTTIERKTRMLGYLDSEAEAMLARARLGQVQPSNRHNPLRSGEFFGSYRVTDLGNNLLLFEYEVAWPPAKARGGWDMYNLEHLSFITTSFVFQDETRQTGERENIIRFQ